MSADQDLSAWTNWTRLLSLWRSEWDILMEYVGDLAPSAGHEEKTILCFALRYGRQIASAHAFTLGRILQESPDPHARKLAVTALAADDLRPHELTMAQEALIDRERDRLWEKVHKRLDRAKDDPDGHN